MPILYAVFVDGHFWRAYTHRITAEMTALGFHGRGEVVAYYCTAVQHSTA